jgi:hypothetical protein
MADGEARRPGDPDPGGASGSGASPDGDSAKGHKRPLWLAALAALVTFLALYGAYSRSSSDTPGQDSPESPGGLFQQSQAAGTSLTAVGRTVGLAEPCTAWLVDTGNADDATAYAVTSSRCVGHVDPASVMSGQELSDARVEFNSFAPLTTAVQPELVTAPVDAVEWASVRGTDLAVLRLGATITELEGQGIRPIDPVAALAEGAEILVAGVPVEGIEANQQFLRGSRCQVGPPSDVLEDGLLGLGAQALDCAGILGGSAGSPVFNPAGEAVAMVTTTTIGATQETACALGLPCQVGDDGGISVKEDTSYMLPVDALAACFPGGTFTLGGDCSLEDPAMVVPARAEAPVARPGSTVPIRLEGELPVGFASTDDLQVKQGELGTVDCAAPDGWLGAAESAAQAAQEAGIVQPAASAGADPGASAQASAAPQASGGPGATGGPVVTTPTPPGLWSYPVILPSDEGFTLVCVGSAEQSTGVVIRTDGTPADPASIELTTTPVEGGVEVEPVFDPPELTAFRWVSGPVDAIDCATAEGYVEYRRVPATIQAADLPSTVCVIGIDEAGNESTPAAITVE